MACPTCDKTMQGLGARWFWCPSCGTILNAENRELSTEMPSGVRVVRACLARGSKIDPDIKFYFQTPGERR